MLVVFRVLPAVNRVNWGGFALGVEVADCAAARAFEADKLPVFSVENKRMVHRPELALSTSCVSEVTDTEPPLTIETLDRIRLLVAVPTEPS